MGYRERRKEAKAYSRQRATALGFALLSGHGAALFLSVLMPFQLVGRVSYPVQAGAWILAAIATAAFGLGAAAAWNGLHAEGEGSRNAAEEFLKSSMNIAMGAIVLAVAVFGLAGLSMVSGSATKSGPNSGEPPPELSEQGSS